MDGNRYNSFFSSQYQQTRKNFSENQKGLNGGTFTSYQQQFNRGRNHQVNVNGNMNHYLQSSHCKRYNNLFERDLEPNQKIRPSRYRGSVADQTNSTQQNNANVREFYKPIQYTPIQRNTSSSVNNTTSYSPLSEPRIQSNYPLPGQKMSTNCQIPDVNISSNYTPVSNQTSNLPPYTQNKINEMLQSSFIELPRARNENLYTNEQNFNQNSRYSNQNSRYYNEKPQYSNQNSLHSQQNKKSQYSNASNYNDCNGSIYSVPNVDNLSLSTPIQQSMLIQGSQRTYKNTASMLPGESMEQPNYLKHFEKYPDQTVPIQSTPQYKSVNQGLRSEKFYQNTGYKNLYSIYLNKPSEKIQEKQQPNSFNFRQIPQIQKSEVECTRDSITENKTIRNIIPIHYNSLGSIKSINQQIQNKQNNLPKFQKKSCNKFQSLQISYKNEQDISRSFNQHSSIPIDLIKYQQQRQKLRMKQKIPRTLENISTNDTTAKEKYQSENQFKSSKNEKLLKTDNAYEEIQYHGDKNEIQIIKNLNESTSSEQTVCEQFDESMSSSNTQSSETSLYIPKSFSESAQENFSINSYKSDSNKLNYSSDNSQLAFETNGHNNSNSFFEYEIKNESWSGTQSNQNSFQSKQMEQSQSADKESHPKQQRSQSSDLSSCENQEKLKFDIKCHRKRNNRRRPLFRFSKGHEKY